jgi:hypothetical protein
MIDLDKFDPDWDFAAHHGKACKPGLPKRHYRIS